MKIENRDIYRCEFCKKVYLIKSACIRHEDVCFKNPINVPACYWCRYLEKKESDMLVEAAVLGQNYGVSFVEQKRTFNVFICGKTNEYLLPIISHKKGSEIPNLLEEQVVMPLKCRFKEEVV